MRFVYTVVGILLVVAACTKFGKNVTLKGRVMNPVTGEGIPGAEVKLLKIVGGYDSNYKTIKSAVTDGSGSFELDKYTWAKPVARCETGELYQLGWTKDGGQTFIDNFELDVKKGKVMNVDFYAVPYGQLHWHIKNINCEGSTDTMWYKIKYQYDNDFLNLWSFPFTGCVDIVGNGADKMENHIIYMKITRPSGTIYKYDTVFVNEIGVTNFDLLY
ncbi:hypothetical protein D3C87_308820 [compost metagenome]